MGSRLRIAERFSRLGPGLVMTTSGCLIGTMASALASAAPDKAVDYTRMWRNGGLTLLGLYLLLFITEEIAHRLIKRRAKEDQF